jgi:hypothetical protein
VASKGTVDERTVRLLGKRRERGTEQATNGEDYRSKRGSRAIKRVLYRCYVVSTATGKGSHF